MGRFNYQDSDNYGNSSSNFFSLKDDGDIARVRFMYNDLNDVTGYAVHEIEVDGNKRYVNCLRNYNEPKSKCPCCANDYMQRAKLYVPLYNVDTKEVQLWERGKKFLGKLQSICTRYARQDSPLVNHVFEIERHGKKGDTQTTYEVYEVGSDDTTLQDLPEVIEPLGNVILDKSYDELDSYVRTGSFATQQVPTRRVDTNEEYSRRTVPSRRSEQF